MINKIISALVQFRVKLSSKLPSRDYLSVQRPSVKKSIFSVKNLFF